MEENKIHPAVRTKRQKIFTVLLVLFSLLLFLGCSVRTSVEKGQHYHTKNTVALYLYSYGELPPNYHKKPRQNSGVQPTDGTYIGGNVFEYRGAITGYTTERNLRECDVDYPAGTTLRGTNRLVYYADGTRVFYTSDHYGTFTELSRFRINGFANVCLILCAVLFTASGVYVLVVVFTKRDRDTLLPDAKVALIDTFVLFGTLVFLPFYLLFSLFSAIFGKHGKKKAGGQEGGEEPPQLPPG